MIYDTWKTTDFEEERFAYEEGMVLKYGDDWRECLEDELAESLIFEEF